jgi:glycosyltransferase involved in cell wall biosynthesis
MPTTEEAATAARKSEESWRVAVVIPCKNEAGSIEKVVRDFRAAVPSADIVVVDNACSDDTAVRALGAGARVISEARPGKGFAVVAGFRAAKGADCFVIVDGDDTYPAEVAPVLIAAVRAGADMVTGTRLVGADQGAFPAGHSVGNQLFRLIVRVLCGVRTKDLFSGYRALSRRLVENTPLLARGFEVEAELSLQASAQGFATVEIPIRYRARPPAEASKLHTFRDGFRILASIVKFFRDYRPLRFFGFLSLLLLALSLLGGSVVIAEFVTTGLVPRMPLAVLSAALFILSALSFTCGVLLSSINRRAAEIAFLLTGR